jgi:hypothetical protein
VNNAGTVRDIGQYNVDYSQGATGNRSSGIQSRMNNDAAYATDQGSINSNSTLAIGNSRAAAATGVGSATATGILGSANANSAGTVAQGNAWGNAFNTATNAYTNMAAMNNRQYNPNLQPLSYANPNNSQMTTYGL